MPLPHVHVSDEVLYEVCNKAVLPAWAFLALFPKWKITNWVVMATALSMSAIYAALIINLTQTSDNLPSLKDFETLSGLTEAFKAAGVLLPAWVHYLAQDLWVAKWVTGDACNKRIPRLLMLPILAAALLVGPAGPLLYFLVVRPLFGKSATTPKGKAAAKQAAAPMAVKADATSKPQVPLPSKSGVNKGQQPTKQAAASAPAPSKKQQPAKQGAPVASEAPAPPKQDTAAASRPKKNGKAPKEDTAGFQTVKNGVTAPGGKNAKAVEAPKQAAPKPAPARKEDLEDDRAFAEAAAALLRNRAQPKK